MRTPTPIHARLLVGPFAACAAVCPLLITGCASSGSSRDAEPVSVGLEAETQASPELPEGGIPIGEQSLADGFRQQAEDLAAMMGNAATNTTDSAGGPEPRIAAQQREGSAMSEPVEISIQEPQADPPTAGASAPPADTGMGIALGDVLGGDEPAAEATEDVIEQIERLVASRVGSSNSPLRDALALIAADMLRPGGDGSTTPIDQQTLDALAPSERETLDTLRAALADAADSPEAVAGSLDRAAQELQRSLGVRVGRVELCSRVDGFGNYVPFVGNTFLARQTNAALVYVEVERFSHRPIAGDDPVITAGDQWAVDLTQEVKLYHKADGRLAWRGETERIVDTSRNRRRDFYLVKRIDLPPTLTVGSYELHVTVTDASSGTSDELAVPIGVVADPALANAHP